MPKRFGYYDMFAGPGMYGDGSISTPLLVAEQCYKDSNLRNRVWMVFNDITNRKSNCGKNKNKKSF